jgi:hypothetical protein
VASSSTDQGDQRIRSLGDGIEAEVIHTIFEEFRRDAPQWLTLHGNGHATLAMSHARSTSGYVSATRRRNMAVFGAATALCLIRGLSVVPLDPLLLQFFIHGCDFESMHASIVGEWHPELKHTLSSWISIGAHGDPTPFQAHFALYHDLQVTSIHALIISDC